MQEIDWQDTHRSPGGQNNLIPIVICILLIIAGLILGAVLGWHSGVDSVRSIAEEGARKGEFVCGTGFPIIVIGSAIMGMVVGAIPGLMLTIVIYFRNRQKKKRDWAAYYGE